MTCLQQAQNVQPLRSHSIHLWIELATSKSEPWMHVKHEEVSAFRGRISLRSGCRARGRRALSAWQPS